MQQIIQGNDTTVSVILYQQSIHLSGTADETQVESTKINLRQVKEISVRLIPYMRWEEVSPDFKVRDNVLEVAFPATQQRQGKWDIDISFLMPSDGGYKQARVKQAFAEVLPTNYPTSTLSAYVVSAEVTTAMRGETGLDAYHTALARGIVASYEEWIEYIRGPQGDKGDAGKDAYKVYLETTTDNPILTEGEWANRNNYHYGIIHRILRGKNKPMAEKKMTGDELIELHSTVQNLAIALQDLGIQASEEEGLSSFISRIREYKPLRIVLFKKTQLHQWVQEDLGRIVEVYIGWDSPDFEHMISYSKKLKRLPEIIGIDRVVNMDHMIYACSSLQGELRLPNLPKVKSMYAMASVCSSLDSLIIGDLPTCKNVSQVIYDCASIRHVVLGATPMLDTAEYAFAKCPLLEHVTVKDGISSSKVGYMFYGCKSLRIVEGVIDVSGAADTINMLDGCGSLEQIMVKGLGDHINLGACNRISPDSLRYLVDNARQVSGKIIFLPRSIFEMRRDEIEALGRDATAKGFTINYQ